MPTREELRKIWNRLPGPQRTFVLTIAAALVVVIVLVAAWAGRQEYGVLYANLDPEDASGIVDQLRSQKVHYRLSDGGGTVWVPRDAVYELRLSLASAGLPQSTGQGYELLDTSKIGWTDFVQKLQFRRALEGEIARTIQALDAVAQARIHIVMPEPSLFVEEQRTPTASVMVKVKPGARLSEGEVQGIVHLVASAVEGLQPESVTVLDTGGRLLSRPRDSESLLAYTTDQISLARTVEEGLVRKAQSALEQVLGPNKAVVRVSADLDFERAETTREIYDSENPVVRSEERSESTSPDNGSTENTVTNYEISKTVQRVVDTPGTVRRLSASVFIDGTYTTNPAGERQYVARNAQEMQKLTTLIQTAIGFDPGRGDVLSVENIAFDDTETVRTLQEMEKTHRWETIQRVGTTAGTAILALGALGLLWRLFTRGSALARRPSTRAPLGEGEALTGATYAVTRDLQASHLDRRLRDISQQSPEVTARVIRAWLREP